ncbi:MAG TPA: hypothetical protein P5181_05180 [Dermatophilaceae bacterium]|nr:hypothetical protein [Dermatophilaceae bacterium]
MTTAPLWQAALVAEQARLDPVVAQAVAAGANPAALRIALQELGPGFDRELSRVTPEHRAGWAVVLVEAVAQGVANGDWGSRSLRHWTVAELGLRLSPYAAPSPALLAGLVVASARLRRQADLHQWGALLCRAAAARDGDGDRQAPAGEHGPAAEPMLTAEAGQALGVVAAWRAGAVGFRAAALRIAPTLSPARARAVLGLDGEADVPAVLAANAADPTVWPGAQLRRLGGLRALGGRFTGHPTVLGGDGLVWLVAEPGGRWWLTADVHGQAWAPAPADAAPPVTPGVAEAGASGGRWRRHTRGRVVLADSATSHELLLGATP